jgi:hypothetical protein
VSSCLANPNAYRLKQSIHVATTCLPTACPDPKEFQVNVCRNGTLLACRSSTLYSCACPTCVHHPRHNFLCLAALPLTKPPATCQHRPMAKGCYTLCDGRDPMIRMYCLDCHRFAQFRRAGLIEQFGTELPMPTLLGKLKPCSIGDGLSRPQCQLAYFDRMMPEHQVAAIERGGLPAAWTVDWHSRRD